VEAINLLSSVESTQSFPVKDFVFQVKDRAGLSAWLHRKTVSATRLSKQQRLLETTSSFYTKFRDFLPVLPPIHEPSTLVAFRPTETTLHEQTLCDTFSRLYPGFHDTDSSLVHLG
jgi:hypothetical protein